MAKKSKKNKSFPDDNGIRQWSPRYKEKRGVAFLPLKENIPNPPANGNGWEETICPNCGKSCWMTPTIRDNKDTIDAMLCSKCATEYLLKKN